jgi:hypothetical protein
MKDIQEEKLYERLRKAVQRRNPNHRLRKSRKGSMIWHSFGSYWIEDQKNNRPVVTKIQIFEMAENYAMADGC